jgi:transcriptional regulator with XRE-family HTH domain
VRSRGGYTHSASSPGADHATAGLAQEARAGLGRRLASLRRNVGLSQHAVGERIGYSRSAVARAEATGLGSRDFYRLAGLLLGAGDKLARACDNAAALTSAERAYAARQAREARLASHEPVVMAGWLAEEPEAAQTVMEAACPSCGKQLAVMLRQTAALHPAGPPEA